MITLGQEGRDKISGFKGLLTARHQYITGCDQYTLSPPTDKEGDLCSQYQFDEGRIEITGPGIAIAEVAAAADPGGPQHPSRVVR